MIDRRSVPLLTAALACGGALTVLAWTLETAAPESSSRPAQGVLMAETSPGPAATQAVDVLDTYLEAVLVRPVFAPERRRPAQAAATNPAEAQMGALPSLDYYRVVGLVVAGAESLALVKSQKSGLTLRLRAGDMMDGWQVTRVDSDAVILMGDGAEQRLAIPRQDGTPQPTSTAASDAP